MLFEITVQEFNHQLNIGQLKYLWHLETEWSLNKTILYSQDFAKYHVGWKDKNLFQPTSWVAGWVLWSGIRQNSQGIWIPY